MAERPVRRMDPWAERFWEYTRQREFRLQRCADCGAYRWPPAPVCDRCLSEAAAWPELSGLGTLLSWVTFHRPYFPEYPTPHTVISVELDEGPLFISYPVEVSEDALRDGLRMAVTWIESHDQFGEYQLPVFRPLAEPAQP